ncbi:hypothetical protein GCM10009821_21290 [Aeromicrobium halocynthiae]|uniref:Uncharacterized protein n=1 Tax=Aeromicrobium halocynthiae TaxID=560557 RepID=A0ABN2W197_9ACTN
MGWVAAGSVRGGRVGRRVAGGGVVAGGVVAGAIGLVRHDDSFGRSGGRPRALRPSATTGVPGPDLDKHRRRRAVGPGGGSGPVGRACGADRVGGTGVVDTSSQVLAHPRERIDPGVTPPERSARAANGNGPRDVLSRGPFVLRARRDSNPKPSDP